VAGRDALGHVSIGTTEAHYEKTVPEAVLKGMRLLEDATAKKITPLSIAIARLESVRMLEDRAGSKNPESRQVTLMHLVLCFAFFMPVAAAMTELKRSGGGTMRYLVAVPSTLVLGALIVLLGWRLGKAL
jgi:hypothetical protein